MNVVLKKSSANERAHNTLTSEHIEGLFKEFYLPLVIYVNRMVVNLELSEDIVQEVFVKYWSKSRNCEGNIYPKGTLFRFAYNASIDYLRHEKVERKRLNSYLSFRQEFELIDDLLAQREIQIRIDRAKNSLPQRCLEVFQLSRDEGLTYGQIAKKMSISIKTVETQISKALRIFRKELNGLY